VNFLESTIEEMTERGRKSHSRSLIDLFGGGSTSKRSQTKRPGSCAYAQRRRNELISLKKKTTKPSRASGGNLLSRLMMNSESLSEGQREVLKIVGRGHSCFFTGSAGTGKSHLLRHIVKTLSGSSTFVTAPTGIAACNVGGVTIHSYAGIGLGKGTIEQLVTKVRKNRHHRKRWVQTKVLIIDEVSMLSADLFDKLDAIARKVRQRPSLPMGGIQVILCGDFHQLPPVCKDATSGGSSFCFESKAWKQLVRPERCVVLRRIFRQKEDTFVRVLNEVRTCVSGTELSEDSKRVLRSLMHAKENRAPPTLSAASDKGRRASSSSNAQVIPTRLHSLNRCVDGVNNRHLANLPGKLHVYEAVDRGTMTYALKACQGLVRLELKVGAQVVLLKNLSVKEGLVNGTRGVVASFRAQETEDGDKRMFPYVKFLVRGSTIGRTIIADEWTLESGGRTVASRSQVPLKLAWALSIHKSQGMTLNSLEVCLDNIFEPGQAYVALSRASSMDGLRIVGSLNLQSIRTSKSVVSFYARLEKKTRNDRNADLTKEAATANTQRVPGGGWMIAARKPGSLLGGRPRSTYASSDSPKKRRKTSAIETAAIDLTRSASARVAPPTTVDLTCSDESAAVSTKKAAGGLLSGLTASDLAWSEEEGLEDDDAFWS